MRKKTYLLSVVLLLIVMISGTTALAANSENKEVSVEIRSPKSIQSTPIYEGDIEIAVRNETNQELHNLDCYLTIVDVGRNQTYPVDEFGENAYQTRNIETLAPGEESIVTIPVKVQYVGNFRFTGSVINYNGNKVTTGKAIEVHIDAVSNLNRRLVTIVSVIVPIFVLALILFLTRRIKKKM